MTCWIVYFTICSYGLSMGLALGCSSQRFTIIRCSHDLRKQAALLIFMNKFWNVCKTHTIFGFSTHLAWETNQTKFIRPFLGCFSFRFNFIFRKEKETLIMSETRIKLKVHTAKRFGCGETSKQHFIEWEKENVFLLLILYFNNKEYIGTWDSAKEAKKKSFKISEFFRRSIVKIYFTRSPSFTCNNCIHSVK